MPSDDVHLARLWEQLQRAIAFSGRPDDPEVRDDRVAALLVEQGSMIRREVVRLRELRGRDLRLLAIEEALPLCALYAAVGDAFGIGCDVATTADAVTAARAYADHAVILADWKLPDVIAVALNAIPPPTLLMTPTLGEMSAARDSPFMERSLGMLIQPFELEPLASIVSHWTVVRLMGGGGKGELRIEN
jgi:hypothetical protein